MGIPLFFRWLSQTVPHMIRPISKDSIPYIDNLYLDMNGILHTAKQGNSTEKEMLSAIVKYLDDLLAIITPSKHLMLAIDGVPPRAKMAQQRQRRYKNQPKDKTPQIPIPKSEESESPDDDLHEDEEDDNSPLDFDSQSITPGTQFMKRLGDAVASFIKDKVETDPLWQKFTIIYSGPEVPGEGEHKIMDFIRDRKQTSDYNPEEVHCIHGMDADLIMLALSTHEKRFTVLRDVFKPKRRRGGRRSGGIFTQDEDVFQLIDFGVLRQYIDSQFNYVKLPFEYSLERVTDDFVLTLFLCGNDFLPSLPTLHISEGALNYFFTLYKQILPSLQGYITEGSSGYIHFDRMIVFLSEIAKVESNVLMNRLQALKKRFRNWPQLCEELKNPQVVSPAINSSPIMPTSTPSSKEEQQEEVEEEEIMEEEEEVKIINNQYFNVYNFINEGQCEVLNASDVDSLQKVLQGRPNVVLSSDSDEQLLIKIAFKEKIKLYGIVLIGPEEDSSPKKLKLFVNQPSMSFEDAEDSPCKQDLTLKNSSDLNPVPVDLLKFQNISHLTMFVYGNHGNKDVTKITRIVLYGAPIAGMDLSKLKKVPRWQRKKKMRGGQQLRNHNNNNNTPQSIESERHQKILASFKQELLFQSLVQTNDTLEFDFAKWRKLYYLKKMNIEDITSLMKSYVEGLMWTFQYYYLGCPSWDWYYPYYYAPLASDMISSPLMDIANSTHFNRGEPAQPFEQILSVLPPKNRMLLPEPLQHFMDNSSPLSDLFPSEIPVDSEGKKFKSDFIMIAPFVDPQRIKSILNGLDWSKFSGEELARNIQGKMKMILWNGSCCVIKEL